MRHLLYSFFSRITWLFRDEVEVLAAHDFINAHLASSIVDTKEIIKWYWDTDGKLHFVVKK